MSTLVSDIINQAYNDLGVIASTAETISATMLADAFRMLNQMWSSWSLEQQMVLPARIAGLALVAATREYSFGPGATWNTTGTSGATGYPLRVTGWGARYSVAGGAILGGGIPLDYASFQAKVKDDIGTSSLIPREFAFHLFSNLSPFSAPSMFCQVWPVPTSSPGLIDLEYMYTIDAFSSTANSLNLPPGYERALHFNLALELAPAYPRPGGVPESLAADARNSKLAIMAFNAAAMGQPAPQ